MARNGQLIGVIIVGIVSLIVLSWGASLIPRQASGEERLLMEKSIAACWPSLSLNENASFSCTSSKCLVQSGSESLATTRREAEAFETGRLAVYECTRTSEETATHYVAAKAVNGSEQVVNQETYSQLFGVVDNARKAYVALLLLKHPEQLETVASKPELVEIRSALAPPFTTDRQTIESDPACKVFISNLDFTEYPYYQELRGVFSVKRAWHIGLEYYLEQASVTKQGTIAHYSEQKIMGCN